MGAVLSVVSSADRRVGDGKEDVDATSGDKSEAAEPRSGLCGAVLREVSMERSASEREDPGPL